MYRRYLLNHPVVRYLLILFWTASLWAQDPFINEFHVDQETVNSMEFVELYVGVPVAIPLLPETILFWTDENGTIIDRVDLNGKGADESGIILIGTEFVPGVDPSGSDPHSALLTAGFPDLGSIILYRGELDIGISNVDVLPLEGILDSVVYTLNGTVPTELSDLADLLLALNQEVINLNMFGQSSHQSAQRFPHGAGAPNETDPYVIGIPTPGAINLSAVLINEVDSDTHIDSPLEEFIELYDGGLGNTILDGLVLVLYDGTSDSSYVTYDLAGRTTDPNGFFVIGNENAPGVDWIIPSSTIQTGTDAIALFIGTGADYPDGSPVIEENLVDALVYGVEDTIDIELMPLLADGQSHVDEDARDNKFRHSMQRFPNKAGGNRVTEEYVVAIPTPKMHNRAAILINEIDADQEGSDTAEFIELYDQGVGNMPLDGLVLTLFDGDTDEIYASFSLNTKTTNAKGFFLVGNSGVANVDLMIDNGILRQEPNAYAVAIYIGEVENYSVGTFISTTDVEEAVVYDIGAGDDGGLLQLLNPGQPQINENGLGNRFAHSLQRFPNGEGGPRNTDTFAPAIPTPKRANIQRTNYVLINEIDSFVSGGDDVEFIELYDGGDGNTPLDGLVCVMFDGNDDRSYHSIDLTGYQTDENGYFLIGDQSVVPAPDIVVVDGLIQNGADAVVLYNSSITLFPNGSAVSFTNIEDAVVYSTGDANDVELLQILNPGQPQVDESGRGNSGAHSLQRYPNGSGGPLNTDTFISVLPTPRAPNFTALVINELDSDTEGTDKLEFVELFDGGRGGSELDGLVLVFYDGVTDTSYMAFDLDGYVTDADGYFLIGNDLLNPEIVIANNTLLNTSSAVAIYNEDGVDFPNGVSVSLVNLSDAIVYGTPEDSGLMPLLNAGQPQLDENGRGNKDGHSLQRSPNGTGGIRNTLSYIHTVPTPRVFNIEMSYDHTRLTRLDDPGNPGGINLEDDGDTNGWTDITSPIQNANSWSTSVSLPFDFRYFGVDVSNFKVSQNGLLTFDDSSDTLPSDDQDNQLLVINESSNANIPEMLPDLTICSFWDQFTSNPPTGTNDQVKMKVFGESPDRQLWIKWFSFQYGNPSSTFNYFSLVLEETTNMVYMVDNNYHGFTEITSTVGVYRDSRLAVQYDPPLGALFAADEISFNTGGGTPGDNDYYAFLPISNQADIEVYSQFSGSMGVGERPTYMLTVTNQGPHGATDILVNVILSEKFSYYSHDSMGRPFDVFSGNWSVGYLPAGEAVVLLIEGDILESGDVTQIAELMEMDGFDGDSTPGNGVVTEDDYHSLTYNVALASDISLVTTIDNATPSRFEEVVFSLTLMNDGPDDAHNLIIEDQLPAEIQFVSSSGSGVYTPVVGTWMIPVLASSESVSLDITGRVRGTSGAEGSGVYSAQLLSVDEGDPDSTPGNDLEEEDDQDSVTFFIRLEYVTVSPDGSEFIVNSHTTDIQAFPDVFSETSGDFMVAWQSEGGQDGDLAGIFGKSFDSLATPVSSEFRMNYTVSDDQKYPQLSGDNTGTVVASWDSMNQDNDQNGVFGMGYDIFGISMVPEFQVNSFTVGEQKNTAIACSRDQSGFVVVWESLGQDGTASSIFGQWFAMDGTPEGAEFPVNSMTDGVQRNAKVAMDTNGNFTVVWESEIDTGMSIYGRKFARDRTPLGDDFKVNTYEMGDQENPDIGMAPAGNFVVVWQGPREDGGFGIFGQKYEADGTSVGREFQANSFTAGYKASPKIYVDDAGFFAVVWHSMNQLAPEADIYGQQFKPTGLAEGVEFRVNETTQWDQLFPSISGDANGNFVVVWQSFSQDGDDEGIVGRLFLAPCEALRQIDQWPNISIITILECLTD